MARVCFILLATVIAVATAVPQIIGGHLGTCPPPPQRVQRCRNFCQENIPGTIGDYYCCDEDDSRDAHLGFCPTNRLLSHEIEVMCDPNDSNRPYSLNCKTDRDCEIWEKCCFTPFTQQKICRFAFYE